MFNVSEWRDEVPESLPEKRVVEVEGENVKIERCITELRSLGIDATADYPSWLQMGLAFASLGESGRCYYHEVSGMHPDYDYQECDNKFTNLLKTSNGRVSIASFFHKCQEHGINIQNQRNRKTKEKSSRTNKNISADYIRVGTAYYKNISTRDKNGNESLRIEKWKKEPIVDDHGRKYLEGIPKYDSFCNVPSHLDYKQSIGNCYNIYRRLTHEFTKGDCPQTLEFLQHIFGEYYDVGLDYLTILMQKPTEKLPILCLVSKENGTGKTTFLKLLQLIFQNNCVVMGNNFFQMDFNSHYIQKLLICIDEGFIELDKPKEKERIKQLATSDRQFIQFKGVDPIEIEYFGKLIMTSNDEERFVRIEIQETRWFVLKVHPFTKENPNLLDALGKELPAFLHLLKTRITTHPKTTRTWFDYNLIATDQMNKVVAQSKLKFMRVIDEFLFECFDTFEVNTLYFVVSDLLEEIKHLDKHMEGIQIKDYFRKLGLKNSKGRSIYRSLKLYNSAHGETTPLQCPWEINKTGHFYKIDKSDIGVPA